MDIFKILTLVIVLVLPPLYSSTTTGATEELAHSPKIKISNDVFFGYGGHVTQQLNTGHNDSTTKTFTRPSSLRRLEILVNDVLIVDQENNNEVGSACKLAGNHHQQPDHETATTKTMSEKNRTVYFKEIAKVFISPYVKL